MYSNLTDFLSFIRDIFTSIFGRFLPSEFFLLLCSILLFLVILAIKRVVIH